MTSDPGPLGIIAGAGSLPGLVVDGAHAAGREVAVVGLRGWADPELASRADSFRECGLLRIGTWIRTLRRAGCREAIMVGRVSKAEMFAMPRWQQWLLYVPDLTALRVWYLGTRDKRDHSLLAAIADELDRRGVPLMDSTQYCREALADVGPLTRRQPSNRAVADASFGWQILKQVAELDIGQSIAVKETDVLAVEAIEGTDALIRRAGELCKAGQWVLLKAARANQDMRFDVPVIGPTTIATLAAARAEAVFVEAGRVLILDRAETLAAADRAGIAVVGYAGVNPQ